jgi:hypothetical protein
LPEDEVGKAENVDGNQLFDIEILAFPDVKIAEKERLIGGATVNFAVIYFTHEGIKHGLSLSKDCFGVLQVNTDNEGRIDAAQAKRIMGFLGDQEQNIEDLMIVSSLGRDRACAIAYTLSDMFGYLPFSCFTDHRDDALRETIELALTPVADEEGP